MKYAIFSSSFIWARICSLIFSLIFVSISPLPPVRSVRLTVFPVVLSMVNTFTYWVPLAMTKVVLIRMLTYRSFWDTIS